MPQTSIDHLQDAQTRISDLIQKSVELMATAATVSMSDQFWDGWFELQKRMIAYQAEIVDSQRRWFEAFGVAAWRH